MQKKRQDLHKKNLASGDVLAAIYANNLPSKINDAIDMLEREEYLAAKESMTFVLKRFKEIEPKILDLVKKEKEGEK